MVSCLAPLCVGWQGIGKCGFNSTLSNKQLGKFARIFFFAGLSFVNQFKLYPFSPTWSSNSQMSAPHISPWVLRGNTFSSCISTIFSCAHIFRHHFNFHRITPRIKWILLAFPWRLWTKPRPRTLFYFFQIGIRMHATFIDKWSF
jgi:hypothetical protein